MFENGDLRTIRLGEHEIIRRLYVAIRDRNWGTVPPVYANLQIEQETDRFRITFDAENQQGEIDFAWRGEITGTADGTITYIMEGQARAAFWKNRIGFCILHPAGLAGTVCEIKHVDGSGESAPLPVTISPDQPVPPFGNLRAISHEVTAGVLAEVRMEGDVFEMEDQRNWTDASFKTFSTPLRIPYPAQMQAGERVRQSVTIRLSGSAHSQEWEMGEDQSSQPEGPVIVQVVIGAKEEKPLPKLGLTLPNNTIPPTERTIERLGRLNLDHLRVDIKLNDGESREKLRLASGLAQRIGARLHVGLIFDPNAASAIPWLEDIRAAVIEISAPVAVWLIYPSKEMFTGGTSVGEAAWMARSVLDGAVQGALFAAGTNTDLIFLQRSLPPFDRVDAVCFAVNPQVHAFDNQSVVETLQAQPDAVRTASRLGNGLPVFVSPVTLKPRHNPYATGPAPTTLAGDLPPDVDPRQASLFGAVWTVGSIRAMAEGGAHSVTYYETTGWRGVLLGEDEPSHEKFPSAPGIVYPLYHILATIAQVRGGVALPAHSSDWRKVGALFMRRGETLCLLLANYTASPKEVIVRGLTKGEAKVRWLDETNARFAMEDPEGYRAVEGEPVKLTGGEIAVRLLPYGVRRFLME